MSFDIIISFLLDILHSSNTGKEIRVHKNSTLVHEVLPELRKVSDCVRSDILKCYNHKTSKVN